MGRLFILLGIQVSPYSITIDLYLIYLYTLALPDEPMHPRTVFSFADITLRHCDAGETGIVRRKMENFLTNTPAMLRPKQASTRYIFHTNSFTLTYRHLMMKARKLSKSVNFN